MTRPQTIDFIDCHDSFSWNLVALLRSFGVDVRVHHPEDPAVHRFLDHPPERLVLSPGPGTPDEHPWIKEIIRRSEKTPIFGICLGMQAIGTAFGLPLRRITPPRHGHPANVEHSGRSVFTGLPSPIVATRYHSLGFFAEDVDARSELEVTATTVDSSRTIVMGLAHRRRPIFGVQFHPESFLTVDGPRLIRRFLEETA